MSVSFRKGDITNFSEDIIVNFLNCNEPPRNKTAISLAKLYPENQSRFDEACELGKITPDKPHVVKLDGGKCIINVSDKKIEDFDKSLRVISNNHPKIMKYCGGENSIAFAPGTFLKWGLVRNKIAEIFEPQPDDLASIILYGEAPKQKFDLATQKDQIIDFVASGGTPLKLTGLKDGNISDDQKWHIYYSEFDREIDPKDLNTFLRATLGLTGGKFSKKGSAGTRTSAKQFKKFAPVDQSGEALEAEKKKKEKDKGVVASSKIKKVKDRPNMLQVNIGRKMMKVKGLSNTQIANAIRLYVSDVNRGFR